MNTPLISVVVPVYGVERYLRQCVNSILLQTYRNLEVILVDDGSKDRCPQIIDEYAAKDKRIKAVHQPNGGYSSAMNHGLDVATGEWIGIVEPDDWIEPEMYEMLIVKALSTGAEIVKSDFNQIIDERKTGAFLKRYMRHEMPDAGTIEDMAQIIGDHSSIWTAIYRRKLIEDNHIRFVHALGAAWTDAPFQINTFLVANRIAWVDAPLYNYRFFVSGGIKNFQIVFDRATEMMDLLEQYRAGVNTCGICYHRILMTIRWVAVTVSPFKLRTGWAEQAKRIVRRMDEKQLATCDLVTSEDRKDAYWLARYPHLRMLKYSLKMWLWKQTKGRIKQMISRK
jgi:glycosyltransferase involved in cell wall biosynthesis